MSIVFPTPDTGLMREIVANHARFLHLFDRANKSLTPKELDFAIYLPDTITMLRSIGLRGDDFIHSQADRFHDLLGEYIPGSEDPFAVKFIDGLTQNDKS